MYKCVYTYIYIHINIYVYKLWLGQNPSQMTSVSVNTPPTQLCVIKFTEASSNSAP